MAPPPEPVDFVQEEAQQLPSVPSPYEGTTITRGQHMAISAYWFATNFIWGALLVIMLPAEIASIAPAYRGPALGILVGLGALVALVVPLIVGALSDRCTSKWGRRRPYIAGGVAINLVGLIVMAAAIMSAPAVIGGRINSVDPVSKSFMFSTGERGDLGLKKVEVEGKKQPLVLSTTLLPNAKIYGGDGSLTAAEFFGTAVAEDRIQATGKLDPKTKRLAASEVRLVKENGQEGGPGLWSTLLASSSFLLMLLGFIIAQFGNNVATAAYSGIIPDLVPEHQRGTASGYMALMSQLGTLLGAVGSGMLLGSQPEIIKYGLLCVVLAGVALVTLLGTKETPLPSRPPKLRWRPYIKSLWIDPRRYPDFAWVWITRAFVMLGFYSVVPFINYYLRDVIGVPADDVSKTASLLIGIILITSTFSGMYGGSLSDRIGRKRVVYFANTAMAIVTVGFVFCNALWQVALVGIIFGLGFGAYTSVDWALGTDVLPSKKDAAKEMGVWHIAMTLPQALAAPLAGTLIAAFGSRIERGTDENVMHYTTNGYAAIFVVCAVLFGLGAFFLKNVKGVK